MYVLLCPYQQKRYKINKHFILFCARVVYDDLNNKKRQNKAERLGAEMENRVHTALEIGQRCRRMRQAQGISQQELADKLHTTPQNISKYETQGISNIEVVQKASAALGHDLLQDEMDTEGTVGEIGKEILQLILREHRC